MQDELVERLGRMGQHGHTLNEMIHEMWRLLEVIENLFAIAAERLLCYDFFGDRVKRNKILEHAPLFHDS